MGIPERKFRERAAMKKLILDAAHELYSEKGLNFTTIRKIAEKIDYSPTTIYLYYPSKDLILYDMQKLAFESLLSTIRLADVDKDAFSRLNDLGKTYIDFGIQNPEKYDLMFLLQSPMNVTELNRPWGNFQKTFEILQRTIKECMAEKSVIYTDPLDGSLQFWCFLHGITSLYIKDRLVNFCGYDQPILDPIYQAWNEYLGRIHVAPGVNN
ncbi:TetR/AcrR family transcriptional regulator [Dyadobacter subterraneus]|uniref:TetR/AcrR family transcriptional regulator n=1 Tax=Dyadobacter subterraneus TaxID=2773304 RepID=A0ABR9WE83_9BACT|nr:TetR/AcrR family transcriptional regulator [Dyadobacter subterraneus]MBE9463735.1 TetR/AcrR family transcriptional regulator [Dyadobacter subterraneus]